MQLTGMICWFLNVSEVRSKVAIWELGGAGVGAGMHVLVNADSAGSRTYVVTA